MSDKVAVYAGTRNVYPQMYTSLKSLLTNTKMDRVYLMIEALADGGVKCGLPRDKAQKYAAQTVLGSALYMLESEKHPGQLKDAVCSPGGSTIEGVMALEAGAFRATASNAVVCAYEKTVKLGK